VWQEPQLLRHAQARAGRSVTLVEHANLEALALEVGNPVLAAAADRVFPDLDDGIGIRAGLRPARQ
jgi:hypothetical protein